MKFILLSHSCPIKDDFAHIQRLMFSWNFNGESLTSVWRNQQNFDYCRLSTSWERPRGCLWGSPRGAADGPLCRRTLSCTQKRTGFPTAAQNRPSTGKQINCPMTEHHSVYKEAIRITFINTENLILNLKSKLQDTYLILSFLKDMTF